MKKIPYLTFEEVEDAGGYSKVDNEVRMGYLELTGILFKKMIMESDKKEEMNMKRIEAYLERYGESILIKTLREANKDNPDYLEKLDAFTMFNDNEYIVLRGLEDTYLDRHLGECAKFGREHKEKYMKQNP